MSFMNCQSGYNCNRYNNCNYNCSNSCNTRCNNYSNNCCNSYRNGCCNSCRPIPCTCPYPSPTPTPTPILQPTFLIANNSTGGSLAISTTGQGLPYTNVIASNGIGIGYSVGTSTISLREPGQYVVFYNVTFTYTDTDSDNDTTSSATVNTYLSLNGVTQVGGNITNTIADGATVTNSGATLINVTSACLMNPATLSLNVINDEAITYSNLSISIYKLC